MLLQQREIMEDQDVHLDNLSRSITRQRDISLQINDELDVHTGLLEGLDHDLDRTDSRLTSARRKLDRVAKGVKGNGAWIPCHRMHAGNLTRHVRRLDRYDRRPHTRAAHPHHCVQDMTLDTPHTLGYARFACMDMYFTPHLIRYDMAIDFSLTTRVESAHSTLSRYRW